MALIRAKVYKSVNHTNEGLKDEKTQVHFCLIMSIVVMVAMQKWPGHFIIGRNRPKEWVLWHLLNCFISSSLVNNIVWLTVVKGLNPKEYKCLPIINLATSTKHTMFFCSIFLFLMYSILACCLIHFILLWHFIVNHLLLNLYTLYTLPYMYCFRLKYM